MKTKDFTLERQLYHLFIHKILCIDQSTINTEVYGYLRTKFQPLKLPLSNDLNDKMYGELHYSKLLYVKYESYKIKE